MRPSVRPSNLYCTTCAHGHVCVCVCVRVCACVCVCVIPYKVFYPYPSLTLLQIIGAFILQVEALNRNKMSIRSSYLDLKCLEMDSKKHFLSPFCDRGPKSCWNILVRDSSAQMCKMNLLKMKHFWNLYSFPYFLMLLTEIVKTLKVKG
jgi:hypothetical protein